MTIEEDAVNFLIRANEGYHKPSPELKRDVLIYIVWLNGIIR